MDACIQIHLPVVRTWSTKCGMFVCEIEWESAYYYSIEAKKLCFDIWILRIKSHGCEIPVVFVVYEDGQVEHQCDLFMI